MLFDSTITENSPLSEWLYYWLETYIRPSAKPAGYEHYRDNCEKHIIPVLGALSMNQLSPRILQRFFNEQTRQGNLRNNGELSTKSMRNMRVILDVALKQAIAEEIISSNPVPLTAIRAVKNERLEVMTDDMQEHLEKHLFQNPNVYHPPILMALYAGLRRGEICALRWRDYDEESGRLSVRQTVRRTTNYDAAPGDVKTKLVFNDVKTDSSNRTLTMPSVLREVLCQQKREYIRDFGFPNENGFIFFNKEGGLIDPDNLQHYFARLLKKLQLPHVKFHAIRHTFATRAIENGVDVSTVSGILGHADVTTTTHFYVHPRDKAMRKAMEGIAPIFQPNSDNLQISKTAS